MNLIKSRLIALAGLLLWTAGCKDGGTKPVTPTDPPPAEISALARAHLNEVIGLMQARSMHRQKIDWTAFRTDVFAAAGPAQRVNQTYSGIRTALSRLGDGHSSYLAADGTVQYVSNRSCQGSGALVPTNVPQNIGYVKVGAFSGTTTQANAFATEIQNTIRTADRDSLVGWIVDLRGNGGGNMWPMIAGLGPIIGEGLIGWFIDPFGVESFWEYRGGTSWSGTFAASRADAPYTLKNPNPKVAVLVDNGVASSGEATFIAFRTRANTRSFGWVTCGLSTANASFPLSDGALLNLTISVMADRTKTVYGDQIEPDERVNGQAAVVTRAIEWLQTPNQ